MFDYRAYGVALLTFLALIGGQAHAAERANASQRVDLGGKTQAEARALISAAADKACCKEYDGLDYKADPIDRLAFNECVKAATAEAVTAFLAQRERSTQLASARR